MGRSQSQAFLLLISGVIFGQLRWSTAPRGLAGAAKGLILVALLGDPITITVTARSWQSVQMLGWGADTTAVGTCGLLLLTKRRYLWLVLIILPFAWCVLASLRMWGLGSVQAPYMAGISGLTFGLMGWRLYRDITNSTT
jgi:hypothetical protein